MMTHLRSLSPLGILYLEAPPLVVSLVIAECFFKFHSFTLEALAFIGVWYALSSLYGWALAHPAARRLGMPDPERFRR